MDSKYWYLKDHKLFNHLNSGELEEVCFISKFRTAKKGEIILFSDSLSNKIFTLKHGSLKIVKIDEEGNEQVKDILKKGDLFGQLDLSENAEDEYAIVMSDRATFCSFNTSDFQRFLVEKPNFALKYTKWMGLWFKRIENKYANIMFKGVKDRLKFFLLDQTNGLEPDHTGMVHLDTNLTHQDIASLICSTRQTVTSLLNQLKQEEILDYNRKKISINVKNLAKR